jgi:hypothetical protein
VNRNDRSFQKVGAGEKTTFCNDRVDRNDRSFQKVGAGEKTSAMIEWTGTTGASWK